MDRKELVMAINRNIKRSMGAMFPGYFQGDTKRNSPWEDYGFPLYPEFADYYAQYKRNGFARAGIQKTIEKCWQDNPELTEDEEAHADTRDEERVKEFADRVQLWQKLKEADEMSRVGDYAALILRFADNKLHREPVDGAVPGGLNGLVEIIPAWQEQLKPSMWDSDERSETYGQPTMYQFIEHAVWDSEQGHVQSRSFDVHPDRVIVWSKDGTVFGQSALEPGLNDLITLQKIIGAGGEGFWKNAKSSPHLQIDPDTNISTLAASLGVPEDEVKDALGEEVEDWQKGFDNLLLTQGIESTNLNVSLPDPEQFVKAPLDSFAASVHTPVTELIGHQSGERASTENQSGWNQYNNSRRMNYIIPNIRRLVDRLAAVGVLPDRDWFIHWSDLTEARIDDKIQRVKDMSEINRNNVSEIVFTEDEMREVMGMEPISNTERIDEDEEDPPQQRTNKVRRAKIVANVHRGAKRGR